MAPSGACELCGRRVAEPTRHHLVPRTRHSNRRIRRDRERSDVRDAVAQLCRPCHKQVHTLFSEKELERSLDTVEKLAAHPEVARFVAWIRDKPDGTHVVARRPRSGSRRRSGPR